MKQKVIKKTIIMITVMALFLPMFIGAESIEAKTKNLNGKTIKLYVGEKTQLAIYNSWGLQTSDKVKWKSSNKKVATVNKKGVVKAKKKGKAKITAKTKSQTFKVTIKVKKKKKTTTNTGGTTNTGTNTASTVTNSNYAKNVVVTTQKLQEGDILCFIKNNNSVTLQKVSVQLKLYDFNGTVLGDDSCTFYNVKGNGAVTYTTVFLSSASKPSFDPSKTNAAVTVGEFSGKTYYDVNNFITAKEYNKDNGKTVLTFSNKLSTKIYISGFMEYRDSAGSLLAIRAIYESIEAGSVVYSTASDPYDSNFNHLPYASSTFVGQAYSYTY